MINQGVFLYSKNHVKPMKLIIAGLDEAGRGAWAGPVFAGACILDKKFPKKILKDSKKLSPKKREEVFEIISSRCDFGIGSASAREIEKLGIVAATNLSMKRALAGLETKPIKLLVDGRDKFYFEIPFTSIIKGDSKVSVISAASIIAKVSRDRYMRELEKSDKYFFAKHKGYGTKLHLEMIKKHGISKDHRRNFNFL